MARCSTDASTVHQHVPATCFVQECLMCQRVHDVAALMGMLIALCSSQRGTCFETQEDSVSSYGVNAVVMSRDILQETIMTLSEHGQHTACAVCDVSFKGVPDYMTVHSLQASLLIQ